jgi:hypothetical protein
MEVVIDTSALIAVLVDEPERKKIVEFVAECLNEDIFTQADTWQELGQDVKEVVAAFYFDQKGPSTICLHIELDELLNHLQGSTTFFCLFYLITPIGVGMIYIY